MPDAMKKRPLIDEQPFPWRCPSCGKKSVEMGTVEHQAEVTHEGRSYSLTIPNLRVPVCGACGEELFTDDVAKQVNAALRERLVLLPPSQIQDGLDRLGLSQKELAERIGVAEATISRWLNETHIQSRSLDRLLRVFFAFPEVRNALPIEGIDAGLGTVDQPVAPGGSRLVH